MKDKQQQQQRNQPGQRQNIGQGSPNQPNRGLGQKEERAEEEEEQQEDKEESQQGSQRQGYQQGEQERKRQ